MKKENFYNIISEGTINGCVIGNFEGHFEDSGFRINYCGTSFDKPEYYIYSFKSEDEPLFEEGTDTDQKYSDFYEALNKFKIKGKSISDQIENIVSCGFIEYIK